MKLNYVRDMLKGMKYLTREIFGEKYGVPLDTADYYITHLENKEYIRNTIKDGKTVFKVLEN